MTQEPTELTPTEEVSHKSELIIASDKIVSGISAFEAKRSELEKLADEAKGLTISDVNDKAGAKIVYDKRILLKNARIEIEKQAKAMRDGLTKVSKDISSREKELIDIIEPTEAELKKEEDRIKKEKEAIEQAAIEAENARIEQRIDSLATFGYQIDYSDIKSMADDTFTKYLEAAKVQHEKEQAEKAEQERIQAEQEEKQRQEQEAERLQIKAERKELEELRKQQEDAARIIREEQERLAAEKKKIEDERQAIEQKRIDEENAAKRAAEIKAAQEEAADKARLKAIEDAKEAERLKAEAEEKARIAAQRKAERAPDKVKIQKYIADVKSVAVPELKTKEAKEVMDKIQELISRFDTFATQQTEAL